MTDSPNRYDAVILGGGAAGLFCALKAGARGCRVVVIEHTQSVGKKIRVSGGGRCNFTNRHTSPDNFISENPRFCYSALSRYTPDEFVAYVEDHRIPYHEKKLGQLFCDDTAQRIIDALYHDCEANGVHIRTGCEVSAIERSDRYVVRTNQGTLEGDALVVATGGLSIPKLGATDFGYRVAEQFGVPIVPPAPALVPLTLAKGELDRLRELSGVAFDTVATAGEASFEEAALITHRGLSGPAILQASSYWRPGRPLVLNLLPQTDAVELLRETKRSAPKSLLKNVLAQSLPTRFAQHLCDVHGWLRPLGEVSDADLSAMAERLQGWALHPNGDEGYAKAEVTRGGIDTRALSPKTMECRDVPGLYFIGEVVDVTGWLGGYNFQWAWASAHATGVALGEVTS